MTSYDSTTVRAALAELHALLGAAVAALPDADAAARLPKLAALAITPGSVPGGVAATLTVTLDRPAPPGGTTVTLTSTSTTAHAESIPMATEWGVGGTGRPTLESVSVSPESVDDGSVATATVTLSRAAPVGGTTVSLASDVTAAATVPASVTVAEGATTADATVTTATVGAVAMVTITASLAGSPDRTDTLSVTPSPLLLAVTVTPDSVQGGASATATVTLTVAAPAGGTTVALASSASSVASVPASVTVLAGATTAQATVTTVVVPASVDVTLTASLAGSPDRTDTVTVTPAAALLSLVVAPDTVEGGDGATATVTLNVAAPGGGTVVTLASSAPATASIPASATVLAGQTTANAAITTVAVGTTALVTFTASLSGSADRTDTLSVTAAPPGGALPGLSGLGLALSTDFVGVASTADLTGTAAAGKPFTPNSLGYALVSLDASVLYDGHQTLKLRFPEGVAGYPKLLQYLGVQYTNLWVRRVWRYSPGFTAVGDGTTWNGSAWISSAAAYKAGPFICEANGGSRAGLELVQGLSGGVYGTEIQLGHHWNNVADSDQYGRGHTHGAYMTSGAWIDSILHFWIDPTEPKRAFVDYYEATAGDTPVLIYDNIYSLDDDAPHPLAGSVQWALNYNQRRRADQTDLAIWYGFIEVVNGTANPNPYGVGGP
jgi:hypothetical protein